MAELTLTLENFEEEVLKSDIPVLVDFWASWCGPCRALAPVIEELANETEGSAKVGKVNVDEQRALAERYMIGSIPTLMVFRGGQIEKTIVGARPKQELASLLK